MSGGNRMHPMRRLAPEDAPVFQSLRLAALQEAPTAFGSSFEEEKDFPAAVIEGRLALQRDRGPFGTFDGQDLVGLVALGRENKRKTAHKALIWGMYVKPTHRGRGIGKALMLEALALARSVPELLQVNLSVNAGNTAAIRLYESLGFQAFGREPGALRIDGESHDEVHMFLRLARA